MVNISVFVIFHYLCVAIQLGGGCHCAPWPQEWRSEALSSLADTTEEETLNAAIRNSCWVFYVEMSPRIQSCVFLIQCGQCCQQWQSVTSWYLASKLKCHQASQKPHSTLCIGVLLLKTWFGEFFFSYSFSWHSSEAVSRLIHLGTSILWTN